MQQHVPLYYVIDDSGNLRLSYNLPMTSTSRVSQSCSHIEWAESFPTAKWISELSPSYNNRMDIPHLVSPNIGVVDLTFSQTSIFVRTRTLVILLFTTTGSWTHPESHPMDAYSSRRRSLRLISIL
jgi:hypothetical protein